ncbi:MAG: RDD family protein [Pseudobdellovibrio sp.]
MQYSGFIRRFLAYIIDCFILAIPSIFLGGSAQSAPGGFGLGFILGIVYYAIFESSVLSATPGKALMGMVVVTEGGDRLSFKAAVIRYFARYLSIAICFIGYLMQLFTSKRQTLHDMLSESVVIDKESPDLNYFTVWKEQFKDVVGRL